jgi:hypothetical protein
MNPFDYATGDIVRSVDTNGRFSFAGRRIEERADLRFNDQRPSSERATPVARSDGAGCPTSLAFFAFHRDDDASSSICSDAIFSRVQIILTVEVQRSKGAGEHFVRCNIRQLWTRRNEESTL